MATKNTKLAIPKDYEANSVESNFSGYVPGVYQDGWNDQGTPANFEFSDGVLLQYDEEEYSEADFFISQYDQMTGYRLNGSTSAKKIYEQSEGFGSAYLFIYSLDFSGHPDLKGKKGPLTLVVKELQAGGDGPIAGLVECSKGLDKAWLLKWVKNASNNDWMVERL